MNNVISEYVDRNGRSPYAAWLGGLRDARARARIILQVDRMELGLFGDSRPIGNGLSELRIHYGPGYRVYYGREGTQALLLLGAGSKPTQAEDIRRAKVHWQDHKRRHCHGA